MQRDRDDRLPRQDCRQQLVFSRRCQNARSDDRLGNRARGECAADFGHQQRGVEQAEIEPAIRFGHAQAEAADLGQAAPQRLVEAERHRRAHSGRTALDIEQSGKALDHERLLF